MGSLGPLFEDNGLCVWGGGGRVEGGTGTGGGLREGGVRKGWGEKGGVTGDGERG